ncbi:MAG: L,D-transpeptidase family protein [Thermodesulfobacteriota bacterium]
MRNFWLSLAFAGLMLTFAGCAGEKAQIVEAEVPQEAPAVTKPPPSPLTPDQQLIKETLKKNGLGLKSPPPTVIVVHKQARRLVLYQGLTPRKTYPVVLGLNPKGDKLCQGDTCTPEGVYRIKAKYPHRRWSRFIWLDYPNNQNWLKFARAKKAGRISPNADIGGHVGIHGTHDELKNLSGENWTRGCISLLNKDVEDLYDWVSENTLVIIEKQ